MTKSRSRPTFPVILDCSLCLALIAFPNLAQGTHYVYGSCTGGLYKVDGKCCRPCHAELGLVIRRECSSTSNTVCGCSPGYFCTDMKGDDCELCVPHRVCSPGQYVKARGTERNNTICEECQAGTFSTNGTLDRCLPWTNCTAQGLYEARPGTAITDAQCSQDSHHQNKNFFINLVIGIFIGIFISICIIIISFLVCRRNNTKDREIPIEAQPPNQASKSRLKIPFLKILPGNMFKMILWNTDFWPRWRRGGT
ncbi:tumor necrosis factor receptor superfamily member 4-like isoform X2 [Sminthopsis crassicaudata]|uniref:tumor necrosis factor receptor superfamily member 4-like isoform X2 n=1 Tax=Sminthopsis crassicaudata TaxID=9301 RepID=UPI003D6865F7